MCIGYEQFEGRWDENARLARDVLKMKPSKGIPQWVLHVMDIPLLEELAGVEEGEYRKNPDEVYMAFQRKIGTCFIDQYLATNSLSMTERGYNSNTERGATTGLEQIERDGILIDSPEAVAEHIEQFVFPDLETQIAECDPENNDSVMALIDMECALQKRFGTNILKVPYSGGFQDFPYLRYGMYGYVNYFMAYALYPDIMEKDFSLQADLAEKKNAIAARAIVEGGLPKVVRLDHDMAGSRGTLVDVKSLDRIWFPHFARSIQPLLDAGIRLLWHCDGNLMQMVPRLIEAGIGGFQGFQYEDGMDYEAICKMTDRNGEPLMIWAGVSVTTTLPRGTKDDVVKELKRLVENGPRIGLFLGASSSITPGTNRENVKTLIEGLNYHRKHDRN